MLLLLLGAATYVYGFAFGIFAPVRMVQFLFPLALVGAITVWALPEAGKAPTQAMERLFFIFFVSLPLWPNYLAIALPGLPWITVARIFGFPLVFLLLLSVSISQAFRREMATRLNAIPLLWKAVAALAAIQTLSLLVSNSPQHSLNRLIVAQMNWIAIFFVAVFAFARPGRLEVWVRIFWIMAVALACLSFWEAKERHILWAGNIPSFLAVEDEAVKGLLQGKIRAGTNQYRVVATFATSLGFSEFLALSMPFALHFLLGVGYRLWMRALAALSIPVILQAIILTDSRLGMVGFLLSGVIYLFFWGLLRWRANRRSIIGPAIVIGYPAFAVAFAAAVLVIPRLRVMTLGGGKHQASNDARLEQLEMAIPKIATHPFGYGIGRGGSGLGYRNPAGGLTIDSQFLHIALDLGIAGFLVFYGIFVIALVYGFRTVLGNLRDREHALLVPLIIALFCYLVIKSIYAGVENQSIVFMMLGAVAALVWRSRGPEAAGPHPTNDSPKRRRFARAIH